MGSIGRRQFLAGAGVLLASETMRSLLPGVLPGAALRAKAGPMRGLYVSKNGTPVSNVQEAVRLSGGIQRWIGADDVVVLKPNGQWRNQGYTHTQCLKALIDVILARPGGFSGEIIIAEHVHRSYAAVEVDGVAAGSNQYCWYMGPAYRTANWSAYNYMELVQYYQANGAPQVTAVPMYDVSAYADKWSAAAGPGAVPEGKHAWVRLSAYAASNGKNLSRSYPILRSPYSGKLVDLKNGVWTGGAYNGQQVKLIFLPTLNNHGNPRAEDYAGATSAVKCHIGFQEGTTLHTIGYNSTASLNRADVVGECVGELLTNVLNPAFYLTCAEYTGYRDRVSSGAVNTKTVGLCADPVSLDYWMCKNVLLPCDPVQTFMNPDLDFNLRRTLLGCNAKGIGTVNPAEMELHLTDWNAQAEISLGTVPGDRTIRLGWQVVGSLGAADSWSIDCASASGTVHPTVTGIPIDARSYTLSGLENYSVHTVTLRAMQGASMLFTESALAMPSDRMVFLPAMGKT